MDKEYTRKDYHCFDWIIGSLDHWIIGLKSIWIHWNWPYLRLCVCFQWLPTDDAQPTLSLINERRKVGRIHESMNFDGNIYTHWLQLQMRLTLWLPSYANISRSPADASLKHFFMIIKTNRKFTAERNLAWTVKRINTFLWKMKNKK